MKIVKLQAENVKKLVAVEISPDGNLVQITGKNGQGKTSVLDSIWWALAGASHIQKAPIRNGENEARIKLDLGELIVTRSFKSADNGKSGFTTSITVTNAEGARFPSPQSLLDGLLGQLSFDPLEFSRMPAKQQFETLKLFVSGVDFAGIEARNRSDFAERTEVNRAAKELEAAAAKIIVPTGAPDQEIDEAKLVEQLTSAGKWNAELEKRKAAREKFLIALEDKEKLIAQKRGQAQALIAEAELMEKDAKEGRKKFEELEPLPDPRDLTALEAEIEKARTGNRAHSLKVQKEGYAVRAAELKAKSEELTAKIEQRNEEKRKKIQEAKFPVAGFGFGDDEILLNGVPFSQASDAEQLRASIAMAMALNPKLRVIRVRDGSLLDEESLRIVAEMADKHDYQVWMERVDSSGKVGFVLEDGHIKK